MNNDDYWLLFARIVLILFYPFWLMILLLDCPTWDDYKEGVILPFKKMGETYV